MNSPARRHSLVKTVWHRTTNSGLWLDRYLPFQTGDPLHGGPDSNEVKEAKADLLAQLAAGEWPEGFESTMRRRKTVLESTRRGFYSRVLVLRPLGRTVVGLGQKGVVESGIALDRAWGVPVLPGSSLKGLAAATAHKLTDDPEWRKETRNVHAGSSFEWLFGTVAHAGLVDFLDGWPEPSVASKPLALDVMTVHYADYYQNEPESTKFSPPDGTESPIPVHFLTTNVVFRVVLVGLERDQQWVDAAADLLTLGLTKLGIGAKTNAGYGYFEVTDGVPRVQPQTQTQLLSSHLSKYPHLGGRAEWLLTKLDAQQGIESETNGSAAAAELHRSFVSAVLSNSSLAVQEADSTLPGVQLLRNALDRFRVEKGEEPKWAQPAGNVFPVADIRAWKSALMSLTKSPSLKNLKRELDEWKITDASAIFKASAAAKTFEALLVESDVPRPSAPALKWLCETFDFHENSRTRDSWATLKSSKGW